MKSSVNKVLLETLDLKSTKISTETALVTETFWDFFKSSSLNNQKLHNLINEWTISYSFRWMQIPVIINNETFWMLQVGKKGSLPFYSHNTEGSIMGWKSCNF